MVPKRSAYQVPYHGEKDSIAKESNMSQAGKLGVVCSDSVEFTSKGQGKSCGAKGYVNPPKLPMA